MTQAQRAHANRKYDLAKVMAMVQSQLAAARMAMH